MIDDRYKATTKRKTPYLKKVDSVGEKQEALAEKISKYVVNRMEASRGGEYDKKCE